MSSNSVLMVPSLVYLSLNTPITLYLLDITFRPSRNTQEKEGMITLISYWALSCGVSAHVAETSKHPNYCTSTVVSLVA